MLSDDIPTRRYLSWSDIDRGARVIVRQMLKDNFCPNHIVGIGRGGIIPASMVLYHYSVLTGNSPMFVTVYAKSYTEDFKRGELQIAVNDLDSLKRMSTDVLVVDDICDSGNTLAAVHEILPEAVTATLYYKEVSHFKPNYHGFADKSGDKYWYVFPWEKRDR